MHSKYEYCKCIYEITEMAQNINKVTNGTNKKQHITL